MATPSTEIDLFRRQVTRLQDTLRELGALTAIVDEQGQDDSERATFFQGEFGDGTNNPDITWSEFVAGVTAIRNLETAYDSNKLAIAKLRE